MTSELSLCFDWVWLDLRSGSGQEPAVYVDKGRKWGNLIHLWGLAELMGPGPQQLLSVHFYGESQPLDRLLKEEEGVTWVSLLTLSLN